MNEPLFPACVPDAALCSPSSRGGAPAPRWGAVVAAAVLQGAGFWAFPKFPFIPALAPLLVLPAVFYLTERSLRGRRVWFPPLACFLAWLFFAGYNWYVAGIMAVSDVTVYNGVLYFIFVFLSLPFVQAWAEFGTVRLPAAEFSSRMNRIITLLLLSAAALLPVAAILTISLANIPWDKAIMDSQFLSWNPVSPFGFFCLFGPLTFAGAVAWAQSPGREGEGAALPFLRRTIGAVSGWVALLAGLGMLGGMVSGILGADGPFPDAKSGKFAALCIIGASFWLCMSLSAREGAWNAKPRAFRIAMQGCVLLFPAFMLWLVGGQMEAWDPSRNIPLWIWKYIGFGVLVLAAFGHGIAALLRCWPEKASLVNVCLHLAVLCVIAATRLPFADPVRFLAEFKAGELVRGDSSWSEHDEKRLVEKYGRYGRAGLERALAERGLSREAWREGMRSGTEVAVAKRMAEYGRDMEAALQTIPVDPPGASVPAEAREWLIRNEHYAYLLRRILVSGEEERKIYLRDLNHDGHAELVCINFTSRASVVIGRKRDGTWWIPGEFRIPEGVGPESALSQRPPAWDDLAAGDIVLPFRWKD